MAFQALVLFVLGFETNQTVSITNVTLLLHFSDVINVFDVIQQCENGGRTTFVGLIILHNN